MQPRLPQRYRILRPLGQGGQGSVWLAIDQLESGAPVAVKVLDGRHDSDRFAPLAAEFLTLSRLSHPCIVRVRGFGTLEADSSAYLASEFVQGPDLLAWAASIAPSRLGEELLDVAAQLLSVLHYLELRGLEHGDVKPFNILIEYEESLTGPRAVPRLIDFGLARLIATAGGPVSLGTRAYLPPANREGMSIRRDLYALGLSLFHAATGRLPFPLADSEATAAWKASGQVARIKTFVPAVPAALDELVAGLTDWHAQSEYRTAREALERLKGRVPFKPLPRPRAAEQIWFPCREAFVQKLLVSAERGGAHLIVAPTATGKSRVLESIALCLQASGWEVMLVRNLEEAQRNASRWQAESPGQDGRRRAVLLDDGVDFAGELPLPLCAAVASALGDRGPQPVQLFLGACQSPTVLAKRLGVSPGALRVHVLERLQAESIAAALCQGFGIDEAPDDVVALLVRETGGMPLLVRAAIDALRRQGAGADFLGHLVIKRPLPQRLLTEPVGDAAGLANLAPALQRTVGLLLAARVPLGVDDVAQVTGQANSLLDSQMLLEEACWRGWAVVDTGAGALRYRAAEKRDRAALATVALGHEEEAVRRRLAKFFMAKLRSKAAVDVGFWLATGFNALALGDLETAVRFALHARRKAQGNQGQGDLVVLLEKTGQSLSRTPFARQGLTSQNAAIVLQLRAAIKHLEGGQWRAALSSLAMVAPAHTSILGRMRRRLQALAHEQAGETSLAREALEDARSQALAATPGPETSLEILAITARLAPLYFRSAKSAEGQRAFLEGRAWLEELTSNTPSANLAVTANGAELSRTLALFATAEAVHGDARHGGRFLDAALAIARQIGREDLLVGPLNELGIAHGQKQRWEDAELAFRELEVIARKSGDRLGALRAVYNRAILRYRLQDLAPAEALFRQAREISDALGPHALAATVWLGLAGVLRERGRILEAVRLYRRVLRARAFPRPNDRAIAHNNLSEAYLALGSVTRSLGHAFQAHRLARQTENRFLASLTLRTRGLARLAAGEPARARADLLQALERAREDRDARAQAEANHYLGLVEGLVGDHNSALARLRASRAAALGAGDKKCSLNATLAILLGLTRLGRTGAARRWLRHSRQEAGGALRRILAATLEPPERMVERILQEVRASATKGELGTAFFALAWLSRPTGDRVLQPPTWSERELRLELDRWLFKLARRLNDRRQSRLISFWLPPRWQAAAPIASSSIASPPQVSTFHPMLFHALSQGASPQEILAGVLSDLRESLGARSVWLILDPKRDRQTVLVLPQGTEVEDSVRQTRRLLAQSLPQEESVIAQPPIYVCRLPLPGQERALGVELAPEKAKQPPRAVLEKALAQSSAWAALALALQERDTAAGESRLAQQKAESELRRLSVTTTRVRRELETADINRLSEVKDRDGAERGAEQSSPSSRQISVAASPAMRAILRRLPRLAKLDIPILIIGESGVGKDWLARRIHELSSRAEHAFVSEICSIPESLMDAELFGHREGAFTDATSSSPGVFERAQGGTIYLDEISSLSPPLQARLLRVLEEKRVRPLGSEESMKVDFRLISSSSLGIDELSEVADFRPELLFRVQGEVIEVPPLRNRPEDIPVLVEEILRTESRQRGRPTLYVHPEALRALSEYSWPGNLRELVNEVQRMLIDDPVEITAAMVRVGKRSRASSATRRTTLSIVPLREARREVEHDLLIRALEANNGNALKTARALKITRRYLTTLLSKHKLKLEEFQTRAHGKKKE